MSDPIRIRFVGHATMLIEIDGVRLITDPIFRNRLLHLRRHGARPASESREPVDAILVSHLHLDHADLRSLRELGSQTPVIAPHGAAEFLRAKGMTEVVELAVGESHEQASLRITATPAVHSGRRIPLVGHRGASCGFDIAGSQRIYFAGDTDAFPEMRTLFDRLDLALLPVWGWGTKLGEGHLDPRGAAGAVAMLRPRIAVPIHWGTYFPIGLERRHRNLLRDPPREFADEVARVAPDVEVRVLEPGAETEIAPA